MYIGHYKSVNKSNELFSSKRDKLDFPMQIKYKGDLYLLTTTHMASSKSQETNITSMAKKHNIPFNIKID
mgnify:CR=1 FL=1|jgi:hypothetical protein